MAFAVELSLGPEAEATVYQVWEALATAGVNRFMLDSGARPHITLAVSEHIQLRDLETATATFAASLKPFRLTLSSIGLFPTAEGILYYGVTVTRTLLEVHSEFSRIFAQHARQPFAYYRPGTWVPHCTLTSGLASMEIGAAVEIVRRAPLPIYSQANELEIIQVVDGRVETLSVLPISHPA